MQKRNTYYSFLKILFLIRFLMQMPHIETRQNVCRKYFKKILLLDRIQ